MYIVELEKLETQVVTKGSLYVVGLDGWVVTLLVIGVVALFVIGVNAAKFFTVTAEGGIVFFSFFLDFWSFFSNFSNFRPIK